MKQALFSLFGILFFAVTNTCFAQESVWLSGRVIDLETNQSLSSAVIIFDSTTTVTTDSLGTFKQFITRGKHRLQIVATDYPKYEESISISSDTSLLFLLDKNATSIEDVTIIADRALITVNGDTIEHNALAYKLNPDATAEDLLKRMPGTTVENGVLKANGEEVKKVTIDGKDFFGDDVSLTIKNLPANMISSVQVYDRTSEQNAFSGFNDGNTTKAINIKTKSGISKARFGKFSLGGGTEETYQATANLHSFNETRRFSILANVNNINQQNFAMQDLLGVMGVQGNLPKLPGMNMSNPQQMQGMFGGMPGGISDFFVNQQGGINSVNSLGLNYADVWGKKWDVSMSYFGNMTSNATESIVKRDYFTQNENESFTYNENTRSASDNQNHRLNMRFQYQIDSMNQLIITPKLSFQTYNQEKAFSSSSQIDSLRINSNSTVYSQDQDAFSVSGSVLYNHRFRAKRNALSIEVSSDNNFQNGEQTNKANTTDQFDSLQVTDQHTTIDGNTQRYSMNAVFTQKIGIRSQLSITYNPFYTDANKDNNTYRRNAITEQYSDFDSALTNVYATASLSNKGGVQYSWTKAKLTLLVGSYVQQTNFTSEQEFPGIFNLDKSFTAILPVVNLNYKTSRTSSVRLNYRANAVLPSLQQLQTVVDNSNPTNLSVGNADLNQQTEHTVQLRYNNINISSGRSLFAFANFTATQNYIGKTADFISADTSINGFAANAGTQLSVYNNLDGYSSFQSFAGYGFKIKPIRCNLNLNGSYNRTTTPVVINKRSSTTTTNMITAGMSLVSNISDQIDFTVGYSGTVNNTVQQQGSQTNYYDNLEIKLNYICFTTLGIGIDYTRTNNIGLNSDFNQDINLLTTSVYYKFGKKREFELKALLFDLLNENNSINRTVSANYLEDSQTKVLQRYGMISFTYQLKNFSSKK